MGCDPGLRERGKGRGYLSAFISVFCLIHPGMKNLCLPPLWDVPKALPTMPSHHNEWHPLKPRAKINLLSFSCFLLVVYRERNHGSYRVSGSVTTLAPSDCSTSPIPPQTAIPVSEKKNKSQDSIYPLKRLRPKDKWTAVQMPCLHRLWMKNVCVSHG